MKKQLFCGLSLIFCIFFAFRALADDEVLNERNVMEAVYRAHNKFDGSAIEGILQNRTLSAEVKRKIIEINTTQINQLTPDKKAQNKKYYQVLLKYSKRKKTEKNSDEKVMMRGDDVFMAIMKIYSYNTLNFRTIQEKYKVGDFIDDKPYRSENKTDWALIFKDGSGQVVDQVYVKFLRMVESGVSNAYRRAIIYYKYSSKVRQIDLVYKNQLMATSETHAKLGQDYPASTVFSDSKWSIHFNASLSDNKFSGFYSFLYRGDATKDEFDGFSDSGSDYRIYGRNTRKELVSDFGLHVVHNLSMGNSTMSRAPSSQETIGGRFPLYPQVVLFEIYKSADLKNKIGSISLVKSILLMEVESLSFEEEKQRDLKSKKIFEILDEADKYILKYNFRSAQKKLLEIHNLIPIKTRKFKEQYANSISGEEFLKIVDREIARLNVRSEPESYDSKDFAIEVKSYRADDKSKIRVEAKIKDDNEIFEEEFVKGSKFKIIALDSSNKVIDERHFDFLKDSPSGCQRNCDHGMLYRVFLKMKYDPLIKKVKIFQGKQLVSESEIQVYHENESGPDSPTN